jgi:hypothetical protein
MTDVIVSNKDVVVEVAQPTVPAAAVPPKIGLVEINQVVQRGSAWMTGNGPPTLAGGQYGDMYLDVDTGDMYLWNGAEWEYQGTFAPSTLTPEEILAAMLTVDGAGSALDADLLDGQHGAYYATQTDMMAVQDKNTAQDGQITTLQSATSANASNISAESTARQSADTTLTNNLNAEITNRTNADTALNTAITTEITNRTADVNAEEAARIAADNALTTSVNSKIGEAPNDGQQYVRKNLSWQPVSVPPGTIVSDTAPANPPDNQMWFESDTGNLYIWYRDADGAQWVMLAPGLGYTPPDLSGYTIKTARTRNRINNPTAQVSQQNGTTAVTASGYPADQIAAGSSGIIFSGQKVTLATPTPEGTLTGVAITATTAKASLAATDYLYELFPVEGLDIADFGWGAAGAKQVVVRFCAVCDQAGTYGFAITNGAGDRAWCGSFTIAQAGVPQVFTIVVPGDTTGTWPVDNTYALSLRFSYAYGSNYVGAAGWGGGNKMGVAGVTNGAAVANAKLTITDVGLYLDPEATGLAPPFNAPSYEDDLARCQRYWCKVNNLFSGQLTSGSAYATNAYLPCHMRVTPTLSGVQVGSGSFPTTPGGITFANFNAVQETRTANATVGSGYYTTTITATARLV